MAIVSVALEALLKFWCPYWNGSYGKTVVRFSSLGRKSMISRIALRPYCGTDECAASPMAVTLMLIEPLCPVAW